MTTTIEKMSNALNAVHVKYGGYFNDTVRFVEHEYGFTVADILDKDGKDVRRFSIVDETKFMWFLLKAK